MGKELYDLNNLKNLKRLSELAPKQAKAFDNFNEVTFEEGALSVKEKEIVAVTIANITQCPYCIDIHTKNAKKAGASLEELVEGVYVGVAVQAGGVVTHATHIPNATADDTSDGLYERSNLKQLSYLGKHAPEAFNGYSQFNSAATQAGELSVKFKELLAVAAGLATQCPYSIDVHTKSAIKAGATDEELAEVSLVASTLKAGGTYAHLSNVIESYEG